MGDEGTRDRSVEAVAEEKQREEKDPFDEIDFGTLLSGLSGPRI